MGPQGLEWEVCDAIFYVKNGHVNNIISHGVSTVPPGTSCADGFWEQGLVGPGKTGEFVPALGLPRTCALSTHNSEGKERAAGERPREGWVVCSGALPPPGFEELSVKLKVTTKSGPLTLQVTGNVPEPHTSMSSCKAS